MKVTNKLNLPEPFKSLVTKEIKELVENRYSVTELLLPTREIILKRRYNHLLSEDVSDMVHTLFGSALHKLMEDADEGETEVKFEYQLGKHTLVGKVDKIEDDTIIDYKTCKVNKITKENFSDDYHQGMIYAYLRFMLHDIKTKKLKFYNLMKDWSKVHFGSNYPSSPIYIWEYNITDSDYFYIESFIQKKLEEIDKGFVDLPSCSEEDRWYTGTKFAVYKKEGDKRADKVFDSEQEAKDYIDNKLNGVGIINVRPGEDLKCNYYCLCSKLCKGGS